MFKIINLKKILKFAFIVYVLFLLYVLFLKYEYRMKMSFDFLSKEHISYCINLKPFYTIKRYLRAYFNHNVSIMTVLENLFGNFILFFPMSFFVLYKFRKISIFKYMIFLMLGIILIEGIQFLLMIGVADIDDLILNFSGAVISYLLIKKTKLK